jgi:putative ABC transport system substrate-binding protein
MPRAIPRFKFGIDARWGAADYDRLHIYAAELSRMAPDVIFAGATPALVALQRETSSLPIVFTQVSDPVKLGLIAGLARPGGNITGFAVVEHAIAGKWLELLKDTAPSRTRILVLTGHICRRSSRRRHRLEYN